MWEKKKNVLRREWLIMLNVVEMLNIMKIEKSLLDLLIYSD